MIRKSKSLMFGAIIIVSQTVVGKAVALLLQVVLAWLMVPEDFGIVAIVLSYAAMAEILKNIGVEDILIRNHNEYARWVNAGFWISLVSGCVAALIIAFSAFSQLAASPIYFSGLFKSLTDT